MGLRDKQEQAKYIWAVITINKGLSDIVASVL